MGEVPRLLGPYGTQGLWVCYTGRRKTQRGQAEKRDPQGQLNLAYPTGIRAEALAFGSKAPYRVVV